MFKRVVQYITVTSLLLVGAVMQLTRTPTFSCEFHFQSVQNINTDELRSEGLIFVDLTDKTFLINIDGLLVHNDKKYIISRTLRMEYKTYNTNANLYKLRGFKLTRYNTDNMDNEIANGFLFGFGVTSDEKVIFIKRVNDDVILFGNHTFPQYGCKRR